MGKQTKKYIMTSTLHTPEITLKKMATTFPKVQIKTSNDAYNFIKQLYTDDIEIYESFFILLLNNAAQTIGFAKISQGGITSTVVDTRMVAKIAIESLAISVVLAHNHPSGKLKPSDQDRSLTKKIKEGLKLLDISVLDHLILSSESYMSFADECLL